jgi:hypothetical protein
MKKVIKNKLEEIVKNNNLKWLENLKPIKKNKKKSK